MIIIRMQHIATEPIVFAPAPSPTTPTPTTTLRVVHRASSTSTFIISAVYIIKVSSLLPTSVDDTWALLEWPQYTPSTCWDRKIQR